MYEKKILLIFIIFASINLVFSQENKEKKINHEQKYKDFLEKAGYKNIKIATLSKGKYQEFHDLDSIVQIGSTFINVNTRKIVGFVKNDTLNQRNNVSVPSRWMSVDPLAHEFYSYSPYNFCLNNPINLIDPDGRAPDWVAKINEETKKMEFIAEKGDNLETLSKQLGISKTKILKSDKSLKNREFKEGESIGLENLKEVSVINDYLSNPKIELTNCSNCALAVNGISQKNTWENSDGVDQMEETPKILEQKFDKVSEKNSSIDNIITFDYTRERVEGDVKTQKFKNTNHMSLENYIQYQTNLQWEGSKTQPAHYGVILLKSPDGMKVQQVLEKPGQLPVAISKMPYKYQTFQPRMSGGQLSIYKKK